MRAGNRDRHGYGAAISSTDLEDRAAHGDLHAGGHFVGGLLPDRPWLRRLLTHSAASLRRDRNGARARKSLRESSEHHQGRREGLPAPASLERESFRSRRRLFFNPWG